MAVDADGDVGKPKDPHGLVLEAWAQGYMVGSLVIMAGVTVANMRKGRLLHKLILIELILGMPHGTFIFPDPPTYGWYLSVTAIFLNISWVMHNIVAWMKNKPFLSRTVSTIYITTVILSVGFWVTEIYANFTYFNNINRLFHYTRPYEALFRDPWWIFTTLNVFWNIKTRYEFGLLELIRVSPRFGILLTAMTLSLAFIIIDILSVTAVFRSSLPEGINPFWKLAFVFKCLTDTIILDDFKTALDRLKHHHLARLGSTALSLDPDNDIDGPPTFVRPSRPSATSAKPTWHASPSPSAPAHRDLEAATAGGDTPWDTPEGPHWTNGWRGAQWPQRGRDAPTSALGSRSRSEVRRESG